MKNQRSMMSPKDHNNLPVTNPEDMKRSVDLPNKEVKIVLTKLNELQENSER